MASHRPLVRIGGRLRQLPIGDTLLMTRIWQAGLSITQGEIVTSPLDWESYLRIAATGTDTVDPADDVTKYRAVSYRRVVAIASPTIATGSTQNVPTTSATAALSVPANTRVNVLSASGKGYITQLLLTPTASGAYQVGTRFELEIDGRTVLNFVITNAANGGVPMIGASGSQQGNTSDGIPLEFRRSMNVYVTAGSTAITAGTVYHRTVSTG